MPSYYFRSIADGEKKVAHSLAEIGRMAQREADRFGQAIQIYTGDTGRKSHRKISMAKNPAGKSKAHVYRGNYPDRIESIGGAKDDFGSRFTMARTNNGALYKIGPVNGKGPKLSSDIHDWPNKQHIGQSEKRR